MRAFRLASGVLRNRKVILGIGAGSLITAGNIKIRNDSKFDAFFAKGFPDELQHRSLFSVLRSAFVYEICSRAWLVKLSLGAMSLCDVFHLSFLYNPFCRYTFYKHFCGGETPQAVMATMDTLQAAGITSCLNYSREVDLDGDMDVNKIASQGVVPPQVPVPSEKNQKVLRQIADKAFESNMHIIDMATYKPGTVCAVKLTPFINPLVLQRYNSILNQYPVESACNYLEHLKSPELSTYEVSELKKFWEYADKLCQFAKEKQIPLFIDAEQTYFQDCMHAVTVDLMRKYNKEVAIVHNTYQLYLKKSRKIMDDHIKKCVAEGWLMGAKLVRGAYLNSEPRFLIHDTKAETDKDFDSAVEAIIAAAAKFAPGDPASASDPIASRKGKWGIMVASHNKKTMFESVNLAETKKVDFTKTSFYLAQLLGMADDITYALAYSQRNQQPNFCIVKYVSCGPISEVLPYLVRRARENIDALDRCKEERAYYRQALRRRIF
ncbi:proline dehydrogenase Put1 [Schizosaccharomyces pombe]|uniref:Probable proline dehydrogenase, mitochondrial n=1 Tax=Schizosaccharomyces pombe (strain 972 / ATCC 24843) TaxID=284812 RepID=PROD_SCHPO|nr:putative proline dehydrogenase [Schizosaccharomyces pombe]O74524.1 RecName: Full=Probable proline dehydrogenase, mitochondrial; AltName: Full=Probable proline oxidase; Flags: Precursor [Schizosaccharomyces pombe 972h-]CAA19353.1 proline dehydrogenase (predicted) [Schizosaccharomyces pombe]|eukprot:NP_588537.1 putative proline dehydrogenase [Schizosaccharomyces pombe]